MHLPSFNSYPLAQAVQEDPEHAVQPAGQEEQAVEPSAEFVPVGQGLQVEEEPAASSVEYVPAGHFVQEAEPCLSE